MRYHLMWAVCVLVGGLMSGEARGQSAADVEIHIIPQLSAGGADVVSALPTAASEIPAGVSYVVEVWLSDVGAVNTGVVSGFVDISYDTLWTDALSVTHGSLFSTLFGGDVIDDGAGLVGDFGGTNALLQGQGIEPDWARLGWVNMVAGSPVTPNVVGLSGQVGVGGIGCFGRICGDVAVTGHDFTITPEPSTGVMVGLCCLLAGRRRCVVGTILLG